MDSKLDLDTGVVEACRQTAAQIAERMAKETAGKTTLSVERSVTRFLGVDGINELEVPLPNALIDHVREAGGIGRGVAYWLGNAMLQSGRDAQQIAEAVGAGELDMCGLPLAEEGAIRDLIAGECQQADGRDPTAYADERREQRERLAEPPPPALRADRDGQRVRGRRARVAPSRRPAATSSR